ncbi:MAG TPA: trypsin-like peptidase domain-containing protein [Acidimicrobiia bacterium]
MVDTTHAGGLAGPGPSDDLTDAGPESLPGRPGDTLWLELSPMSSSAVPPTRRRSAWRSVGLVGLSALIGAAVATSVTLTLSDREPATVTTVAERIETRILTPASAGSTAAAVALKVLPSIVTVEVDLTGGSEFVTDASGSGVVLDSAGHLVTNHHVVEGGVTVRVVFADGRIYPATVVGTDPLTDLAVIEIDAAGLTPIEIGSSEGMSIGDVAIAIGSPLGLEGGPSVTVGVLSAFDRRVQTDADSELFGMLQTDAPITRGSSGGALVDAEGRLIGITSAIGVSDVGAEGLGFAIPVELVTRVSGEIIESGAASHAFLGISGTTHFDTLADGALTPAGVEVATVMDETAAAAAGLAPGDVILSFDGEAIRTMEGLVVRLRFHHVGDAIPLHVRRGADELDLTVVLLERPEGT